jgi:hypothetical protein
MGDASVHAARVIIAQRNARIERIGGSRVAFMVNIPTSPRCCAKPPLAMGYRCSASISWVVAFLSIGEDTLS